MIRLLAEADKRVAARYDLLAIPVTDDEGKLVYANDAFFDLFGFDHSLLGLGRWPPADRDVATTVARLVGDEFTIGVQSWRITRIARDEAFRTRLGAGARDRVARIGLWDSKIRWLLALYDEILNPTQTSEIREAC